MRERCERRQTASADSGNLTAYWSLLDTRTTAGKVVFPGRPGCGAASPIRTGTVDDLGSRAETTSILVTMARPTVAGAVAFDAASVRASRLPESISAGKITDMATVMTVMAIPAIPNATRGMEGS